MGTALNKQASMAGRTITNFGDSYLVANLPVSAWLILPVGVGNGLALMGRYSPQVVPWGAGNSLSDSHAAFGGYLSVGGTSLGLVQQMGGLQDGTSLRLGAGVQVRRHGEACQHRSVPEGVNRLQALLG
jgi:hypothetical protein